MKEIILLSIVNASVSFTITETKLFEPFRLWLEKKSQFLGKLFTCGYCLGHWVAFFLVVIYQPRLFTSIIMIIDYFFTALVIAWLGGIQWAGMCYLIKICEK